MSRTSSARKRPMWAGAIIFCLIAPLSAAQAKDESATLRVVSSRPDIVSGPDALVEADLRNLDPQRVTVFINGKRSSARLARDGGGRRLFKASGLTPGDNRIDLRLANKMIASQRLRAFPIGGPIFSGPRQQPWICQTDRFKLPDGTTLAKSSGPDCSAPTVVSYVYRSKTERFLPLPDPRTRPDDLVQTTTSDGKTLDFVVRVETGTIDRGIYQYAVLVDPAKDADSSPWKPLSAWNRNLVYSFGGSCGPGYHQGIATAPVLQASALGKGYAVASSTLNVWGNVCNSVVSAEALSMVKARFILNFGTIRHTIGVGLSGGAKSQFQIADNYPGLLDGLLPGIQAEGPDGVTANPAIVDCSLLVRYFNAGTKLAWTYDQKTAVAGWAGWNNCEAKAKPPVVAGASSPRPGGMALSWDGLFSPSYVVASAHQPAQIIGCDVSIPNDQIYDRQKKPGGLRCDVYSGQMNLWGERPDRPGTPRRPLDSVGLQYGFLAFQAGAISAEQFVELNEMISGYGPDGEMVSERTVADKNALGLAYRSGQVTEGGGGLASVPIIDLRLYTETNPDVHDRVGSFVARARMMATYGNASNDVLYTFPGKVNDAVNDGALDDMRAWLDRIDADTSKAPPAQKIRDNRGSLVDSCWDPDGVRFAEPADPAAGNRCNGYYPVHKNPRLVAGMPIQLDVLKCQLKPIDPADYRQPLSEQLLARLRKVFPAGVCDFSRPGVGFERLAGTWLNYAAPGAPVSLRAIGGPR